MIAPLTPCGPEQIAHIAVWGRVRGGMDYRAMSEASQSLRVDCWNTLSWSTRHQPHFCRDATGEGESSCR